MGMVRLLQYIHVCIMTGSAPIVKIRVLEWNKQNLTLFKASKRVCFKCTIWVHFDLEKATTVNLA